MISEPFNPLNTPMRFPTDLSREYLQKYIVDRNSTGINESVLRSYHMLELVKVLLNKKVAHDVILQIIDLNYQTGKLDPDWTKPE